MIEFLRRNQVLLASGLFLTLSFALLTLNRGDSRRVDPLGAVFLEVLQPLQSLVGTSLGAVVGVWEGYVNLVGVARENEVLRERLRELEAERNRAVEIGLQNERLQLLLSFRGELGGESIAARITGRGSTSLFQSFTLDRGENDGVRPGMAVVCADGVVGRIAQVSPNASHVLLITNHNSGVDAVIQRTRARGIVEGALEGGAVMKYVKRTEDIEIGDVVVTSGLDRIYPKGVRIGRIVEVTRKDYGLFQVATLVPSVDFSRLEEVLVVTVPPAPPEESFHGAHDLPEGASSPVAPLAGEDAR